VAVEERGVRSGAGLASNAMDEVASRQPPWIHLLDALQRGWREKEIGRGRDPDPHIERELRKAGVWPEVGDPSGDA
jgi:hypothetical protein